MIDRPYEVELPVFEGPLDLLLHLVKKHELEIFDIPIAFITEKYLGYLEMMRALSLEIAGEYLLMAATLMYLKSRELLPSPDPAQASEIEDDEADPREELIRRLLEYQRYKDAAERLGSRPVVGRSVWTRGQKIEHETSESSLAEVSVFKLIEALGGLMSRAKLNLTHDVVVDRISIAERIQQLCDRLAREDTFTFVSCFELDGLTEQQARLDVVTTFLAILELARLKMVRIHQVEEGEIYLNRAVQDLERAAAEASSNITSADEAVAPPPQAMLPPEAAAAARTLAAEDPKDHE
jgi:segregation and condensation protein A